jgi:hypothetical protein
MKMPAKLRKKEKAFILTCLVLLFLFGIFLFIDVTRKSDIMADDGNVIGKMLFMHNDVRRKDLAGSAGSGLRPGDDVLSGNTLITGIDSSATVALRDGTAVDMCQDSIVAFEKSGRDIIINLEKGCADMRTGGEGAAGGIKPVIVAGNKRITLSEGDLSIAKPSGAEPELFVRNGKAKVRVNGEEKTVEANERAVLKPDSIVIEKKNLILVSPADNARYYSDREAADLEFLWEYHGKKGDKAGYLVEISNNLGFSAITRHANSTDEVAAVTMPEGDYFWRVSAKNREGVKREISETRRFTVSRDASLKLLNPSDGETVEYADEPPLIAFTWEPHRLASSYALELSDRNDFSRIIKKIDSKAVNFSCQWDQNLRPREARTFYWRVTAGGGPKNWPGKRSTGRHFIVKRTDHLTPPRLVFPTDGKKMSRTHVDKEHVVFSWEKTEENLNKKIIFSKNSSFDAIYAEIPIKTDHWTMNKSFPAGSYYWRVGLYDDSGKRRVMSKSRVFDLREFEDLALLSPEDRSDFIINDINEKGLRFNWKKPELKGRFVVELSGDREFGKIRNSVSTASDRATMGGMATGEYYWRVKLVNDDNTVAAASDMRSFTVRDGIAPPVIISPRRGGAVDMKTADQLKFLWKPAREANAYQLELHQFVKEKRKTRDKLVLSARTDDVKYSVTDMNVLDVGNFYWTLKAIKKDRRGNVVRSSKTVRTDFNINLGTSKIIIVSPEIQVIEDNKGK